MKEGSYSTKVHLSSPQNHLRWRRGLVNGQRVHLGLNTGQCALILGVWRGKGWKHRGGRPKYWSLSVSCPAEAIFDRNTFNSVVLPRRIFQVSTMLNMFVNTKWYSAKPRGIFHFWRSTLDQGKSPDPDVNHLLLTIKTLGEKGEGMIGTVTEA